MAFRWTGAALAAAIMAFPLLVRAIRLGIEAIDPGMEEAAATLGANRLRIFLTVTLPLALPGVLAGTVLAFAKALGEFGATITFVSNIPGQTQTIPTAIYAASANPRPGGRGLPTDRDLRDPVRRCVDRVRGSGAKGAAMIGRVSLCHALGAMRLEVDLEIAPGITALFGPSGAGKTSVLRAVAGLLAPDKGQIEIGGATWLDTRTNTNRPTHQRGVGYVFQEPRLFPHLSVAQNLAMGKSPG